MSEKGERERERERERDRERERERRDAGADCHDSYYNETMIMAKLLQNMMMVIMTTQ